MSVFFPCKMSFLDHKNSIRPYVCLNGKNRACSPNLTLKVCVFFLLFFFFLVQVLSKLLRCGGKHMFSSSSKHKGENKVHFITKCVNRFAFNLLQESQLGQVVHVFSVLLLPSCKGTYFGTDLPVYNLISCFSVLPRCHNRTCCYSLERVNAV